MDAAKFFRGTMRRYAPGIWSLAWPTMLEELSQTAVQYIDTFMVASLGTAATAAVGATATVNWLVGSAIYALGVGFLSRISQALGADDGRLARRISAQAVWVTAVTGLFFTAVTLGLSRYVPVWMQVDPALRETAARYFFILYSPMLFRCAGILFGTVLRAAGDTRTPMRVGLIVNLTNIVLNFFLIYPTRQASLFGYGFTVPGAGWGTDGAAAASAAALALGGILLTVSLLRHPTVSPLGERLLPDPEILRPCLRIAVPNMAQRFLTSLGYVVFASMINALGETATAAHTIANTVESAFYIPGYGMQSAAATLTGNALGAGNRREVRPLGRAIVIIELALMTVSGALLFAFSPQMIAVYTRDAAVAALGVTVLRMVALSEPFYGVSIITEGILQGAGKTGVPFVFNTLCMWGVRIGGTFVCTRLLGLGLVSAWACMIANNLSLLVCFRIYFRYCFAGKEDQTV